MSEPGWDEVRAAGIAVPERTKPRVVVCTAHTSNYKPIADISVPLMQRYAERHGYAFWYEPEWEKIVPNDGDRMKVRLFKHAFASGEFDVFFWIDSDALVMRSDRDVVGLLERLHVGDDKHFLWAEDASGPNSGIYLARCTWQGYMFQHAQFCRSTEMGWGDNTAMIQAMITPPFRDWVATVPGRFLNAYLYDQYGWEHMREIGDYELAKSRDEEFILHFPGMANDVRGELMRQYAAQAR